MKVKVAVAVMAVVATVGLSMAEVTVKEVHLVVKAEVDHGDLEVLDREVKVMVMR